MKNIDEAKELARMMSLIGKLANRETVCVLTNMDEPLGYSVGNSLEIVEAIQALKGNMKDDVKEVILAISSQIMKLSGKYPNISENEYKVNEVLENGKAFEKFKELVKKQGGDISFLENPDKFEKAPIVLPVISDFSGYVEELNAEKVGKAGVELGIGRIHKEDSIDYRVGLIFNKKVGDKVDKGEILAYVHANSQEKAEKCINKIKNAYTIGDRRILKKNIIEII